MRLLARIQQGLGRRTTIVVVTVGVAAGGGLGSAASSSPAASTTAVPSTPNNVGQAQQQLAAGQRRVSQLAGTVSGAGQRASDLRTSVTALQAQVSRLQGDLNVRRTQLLRVRDQLDAAGRRLGGLEVAKAAAEHVLAGQLVGSYEAGRSDIISVVLDANGFPDLLERLAFAQRIGRQDARIVARVRSARQAVATEAGTLGRLTARARWVADSVLSERNQVAHYRLALVAQQLTVARAKAVAAGQLVSAQTEVDQLTHQLDRLRAAQPSTPTPVVAGSTPVSKPAGMPFPMPSGAVGPPATWSLGDGVDIAAPAGTPELAVCSGTIVLHGIGGMGPSAPVLRCNQPLAGHTYVYYGFTGLRPLEATGTDLVRGQPLARVGAGIIGASTGPHLEIGFADAAGTPLGPTSAHQMLALLRIASGS